MRIRLLIAMLVAAALLLPHVQPWLKTPFIMALANGLAVLGAIILIRAGQVSFGSAMFACIAGYAATFAARLWQWDALALIAVGTTAGALLGALVGLFMVRYRGIFFGMLNLAFSMVLFSIIVKFSRITNGTDGLRLPRPTIAGMQLERDVYESVLLVLAVGAAVLCGWLVQRYFRSSAGQTLAAIKTNETRLEYLGISPKRVFWVGYVIAAALCGLGGSLFALTQGLVTPEMGYWVRSAEIVFIAILGGAGHALGAFLGAFVFEFAKLYLAAYIQGAWQMALGIVLLVIIFAAPAGLFGLFARYLPGARANATSPITKGARP